MGFDKGTITNATVVTISLLAVVGLLVVGATPAAAQSNESVDDGTPEFDFQIDDGSNFGFSGDDSSGNESPFSGIGDDDGDAPDFGGIGGDDGESPFDFDGIGEGGDGPDFGGIGEDGDAPDFSGIGEGGDGPDFSGIGEGGDGPDFSGIGEGGDGPDFSGIGEGGDGPDFGGIGEDGDAPDFGGIGEDGDAPDFGGIGDGDAPDIGDGDDGQDGEDGQDGDDGEEPAPADFQVSNLNAPAEATIGDTISVSANVENVGGSESTQSVAFGVDTDDDGQLEEIASQDVTLVSSASTTVTFDVDTSSLSAGTYTHGVSTANDSAQAQITLNSPQPDQPANFQIQNVETNSPVTEGDDIIVNVTIENTGDEEGTQLMGVSVLESRNRLFETLAGGETWVVSTSFKTFPGDAGTSDLTVETNNDTATTKLTVTEPGATGTVGGTVSDASGSAIDGATVQAGGQSTTTSADGSYTLTLDGGEYTVEASAQGYNTSSQTVTVTAGETTTADFTLGEVTTTGTVKGTVVNVSSGSGIGGATVTAGSQSTTTSADGSYTLTLTTGEYTVEASAQDYNTSSQTVTVTDGGTETANFHLQSTDSGSGVPEYQSFTAYTESGYLQVGSNSLRSELPDCPGGVPENKSKGCVKFTADLDPATGDFTVSPENFQFPPIPFDDTTLGTVPANNTLQGTITGNLDLETGEGSFNAPIFSYLEDPALKDTCGLEVNVEGTTGTSGTLTGEPGALQPDGTARATLVDGTFSIPAATQETCGDLSTAVNNDVGLPSGSGESEIVQNLYIEFSEETVENNPDAPSNN